MRLEIVKQNVGMPSLKSFEKIRSECNTRAYYKLMGNYYKARQRFDVVHQAEQETLKESQNAK